MCTRGFGYYVTQINQVMMAIGIVVGIMRINHEERALYGITILYLMRITDGLYRNWRSIILFEGLMVSAERVLQVLDLPQ
jgi:hypothetical protein